MIVVPYRAAHLLAIEAEPEQAKYAANLTPAVAASLEGPYAMTGVADGRPIGCAGLQQRWLGYWSAWAYFGAGAGKHMVEITRAVREAIPTLPRGRIEAATPIGFKAGHRWLRMLGFEKEADRMRHYGPDGSDFALYSLVLK